MVILIISLLLLLISLLCILILIILLRIIILSWWISSILIWSLHLCWIISSKKFYQISLKLRIRRDCVSTSILISLLNWIWIISSKKFNQISLELCIICIRWWSYLSCWCWINILISSNPIRCEFLLSTLSRITNWISHNRCPSQWILYSISYILIELACNATFLSILPLFWT